MERTDAYLIKEALDGQDDAFRQIVTTYSTMVFAVAYRMMGNQHDAEEVVQDTFLRAYRQLDRFDGRSSLRTWLYRIAGNRAIDLLRARKRKDPVESLDDQSQEPGAEPSQDIQLNNRAVRKQLWQALDTLSPDERTAFVMRHFENQPIRDIAAALDIQANAAKNTVFRAVRKLREALAHLRTI